MSEKSNEEPIARRHSSKHGTPFCQVDGPAGILHDQTHAEGLSANGSHRSIDVVDTVSRVGLIVR